jgi:hypothetical protein
LLANGVVGAERGWGRPVGPADPVGWPVGSVDVRVAISSNHNYNKTSKSTDALLHFMGPRPIQVLYCILNA